MAYQEQLDREKHEKFIRDMDEAESNVQKIYSKLLHTSVEKIDVGDTLAGYTVEGKKTILWTEQAPQQLEFHPYDEKHTSDEMVQDHSKT